MFILLRNALLVGFYLSLTGVAIAADLQIIANNSISADAISKDDVKSIFNGSKTSFGGQTVSPAVMEEGYAASAGFFSSILGMDFGKFQKSWIAKELSGAGTMPKALKSAAEMISHVSASNGGIGYVTKADFEAMGKGKVKALNLN